MKRFLVSSLQTAALLWVLSTAVAAQSDPNQCVGGPQSGPCNRTTSGTGAVGQGPDKIRSAETPEEEKRDPREREIIERERELLQQGLGLEERAQGERRPTAEELAEENEFQRFVRITVGRRLPMFGYDLFVAAPSTFAPLDRVPVTSDYVIGPGDQIVVRAWGQVDMDFQGTVDRNGLLYIPKVGNVMVSGLKYEQLEPFLEKEIGKIFRNFELSVTLGQLRSIPIFVVGQAKRPGSYTVSSMSTLVNALFASGGPSVRGSMRGIQLKRNGKVVTEFDLYDLLLRGDKSKDVQLVPGDVIFIPTIGPLVAVAGSVNLPAIYEVKPQTTLGQVIEFAGGLTPTASLANATVERIVERTARVVNEIVADTNGFAQPLADGDLVTIRPLLARFDKTVTLRGNVAAPGRYPWREGMRVSDLIPSRTALITPEFWLRQNQSVQPLAGQSDLRTDVKRAAPEINWDYAVVQRFHRDQLTTDLLPFNLGRAIAETASNDNLVLHEGDILTIFSQADINVPSAQQSRFVRVEGEVKVAGVYKVQAGETLRGLVNRIGGLAPNSYLFAAEFTRVATRIEQQQRLDEYISEAERELQVTLSQAAQAATDPEEAKALRDRIEDQRRMLDKLRTLQSTGRIVLGVLPWENAVENLPDIALEDGDRLVIPQRPATVNVLGAVFNANSFLYRENGTVGDYLKMAGGTLRRADEGQVFVIRADGSSVSRRHGGRWFGSGFYNLKLMPGDSIIVPEQFEKTTMLRQLRDWSQVFSQFALGVAGIRVLARD